MQGKPEVHGGVTDTAMVCSSLHHIHNSVVCKLDTYISNHTYQLIKQNRSFLPSCFAHSAMLPSPFQETFSFMFDFIAHWVVKIF